MARMFEFVAVFTSADFGFRVVQQGFALSIGATGISGFTMVNCANKTIHFFFYHFIVEGLYEIRRLETLRMVEFVVVLSFTCVYPHSGLLSKGSNKHRQIHMG